MWRLSTLLILCYAVTTISAIKFELGPGKEECFYEEAHSKTMISGVFAVTDGTQPNIDVVVTDPQNHIVYETINEGEGKFSFRTDQDGSYKFCFGNKHSMMNKKVVSIAIHSGEVVDVDKLAKKEHLDNIQRWIVSIGDTVREVDYRQHEYKVLHERHLNSKLFHGLCLKERFFLFLFGSIDMCWFFNES